MNTKKEILMTNNDENNITENMLVDTKITLRVNKEYWKKFQKIAKLNESDGSKEIRKYIKQVVLDNNARID